MTGQPAPQPPAPRGTYAYCPRCEGPKATTDIPCAHHIENARQDYIDNHRPDPADL